MALDDAQDAIENGIYASRTIDLKLSKIKDKNENIKP
jgi:hypothetical protein